MTISMEFVVASHKKDVFSNNIGKSKIFLENKYRFTVQKGYSSVSKAYNDVKTYSDIVVYLHHDVFLPDTFEDDLRNSLKLLNSIDSNWGVAGPAGIITTINFKEPAGFVLDRGIVWGSPKGLPTEVDTLDELMIITHGDLKFDEDLPGIHFYGADICMQAKLLGRKSYAIKAFCHHNSGMTCPAEDVPGFIECREYFRNKYADYLPIATTCANLR